MYKRIRKDIEIVLFVQAEIILFSILMFIVTTLIGVDTNTINKLPIGLILMDIVLSIFCVMLNHTGYLDNL